MPRERRGERSDRGPETAGRDFEAAAVRFLPAQSQMRTRVHRVSRIRAVHAPRIRGPHGIRAAAAYPRFVGTGDGSTAKGQGA
jgi:hypothetical protein